MTLDCFRDYGIVYRLGGSVDDTARLRLSMCVYGLYRLTTKKEAYSLYLRLYIPREDTAFTLIHMCRTMHDAVTRKYKRNANAPAE